MESEIIETLDEIHAVILAGKFDRLAELSQQLEEVMAHIESPPAPVADLLRQNTQRNRDCLAAALRGMRAAHQRISDIRKASQGLTTYDHRGATALLGSFPALPRRV